MRETSLFTNPLLIDMSLLWLHALSDDISDDDVNDDDDDDVTDDISEDVAEALDTLNHGWPKLSHGEGCQEGE